MANEQVSVRVSILGKDYPIGCPPQERESLIASAKLLDERMREIREHSRLTSPDTMAIMAALNLTHELLQCRARAHADEGRLAERLEALVRRIDEGLTGDEDPVFLP